MDRKTRWIICFVCESHRRIIGVPLSAQQCKNKKNCIYIIWHKLYPVGALISHCPYHSCSRDGLKIPKQGPHKYHPNSWFGTYIHNTSLCIQTPAGTILSTHNKCGNCPVWELTHRSYCIKDVNHFVQKWHNSIAIDMKMPVCFVNRQYAALTHLTLDKMAGISQTTFSDAFSRMKMLEFRLQFDWNFFLVSPWQYVCIGLDNDLAPNRRQTIAWTNADPVHRRIYASLRGN